MRLDKASGVILIPPNCGQELFDVIEISDCLSNQNRKKYRIIGIGLVYNKLKGEYYQRVRLGGI